MGPTNQPTNQPTQKEKVQNEQQKISSEIRISRLTNATTTTEWRKDDDTVPCRDTFDERE